MVRCGIEPAPQVVRSAVTPTTCGKHRSTSSTSGATVLSDPGVDTVGTHEVPVELSGPPDPQGGVGFAHITVEAGRHAVAHVGRATLGLRSYVIDGGGVGSAVGAGVIPGSED